MCTTAKAEITHGNIFKAFKTLLLLIFRYLFSSLQRCCRTAQAPDGPDLLDRWAKHCKLMGAQTTPSITSYLTVGIRDWIVSEPRSQLR